MNYISIELVFNKDKILIIFESNGRNNSLHDKSN